MQLIPFSSDLLQKNHNRTYKRICKNSSLRLFYSCIFVETVLFTGIEGYKSQFSVFNKMRSHNPQLNSN